MPLQLSSPSDTINHLITFIRDTYHQQGMNQAVIAVSGGIDSAVSATLLSRALGADHVTPLLLPYGDQNLADGENICQFNGLNQVKAHNIQPIVKAVETELGEIDDPVRRGNVMARSRMLVVFDYAKKLSALVCGTENKSEHFLGYFTRFGDAASDLEPISGLYKTQVRQIARELGVPEPIIAKAPSAGLWSGQTDEQEMGFTYDQADQVMWELLEVQKLSLPLTENVTVEGVEPEVVRQVIHQINSQHFKHLVPYMPSER